MIILAVRYGTSVPWHPFPGAVVGLGGYNGPYNQESHYADRDKTAAISLRMNITYLNSLHICLFAFMTSYDCSDFLQWRDSRWTAFGRLSTDTSPDSLGDCGTRLSCSARWVSLEVLNHCIGLCTDTLANEITLGLEEALVGTMVEQQSFIKDFGLDKISDDQKAETVGNVVSMSQLGCIAGALV